MVVAAETGSGKTLAYLIPMIMKLMQEPERTALILVPTRELAKQVDDSARALRGHARLFRTAVLIGGEAIQKQFLQLQHNPRVESPSNLRLMFLSPSGFTPFLDLLDTLL